MTAAPALEAVTGDFLYCLGLGMLLAALRDASGLLLGNGPVRGFVWDIAAFLAAAIALCGFAAGASAAGITRWYMAAGLALGALAWQGAVSGAVHAIGRAVLRRLELLPRRTAALRAARQLGREGRKRKKSLSKSNKQEKNVANKQQDIV